VAVLRPFVQTLVRTVLDHGHDLLLRRAVRAQLVSDDALRRHSLLIQQSRQQPLVGLGVAADLLDSVEYIPILINCPPQPVLLTSNTDDDLIQMPDVVGPCWLAAEAAGIVPPEFQAPTPSGFAGEDDASLQQHFLDHAQAQGETKYSHTARAMISCG
jgi:hypothetical protein